MARKSVLLAYIKKKEGNLLALVSSMVHWHLKHQSLLSLKRSQFMAFLFWLLFLPTTQNGSCLEMTNF